MLFFIIKISNITSKSLKIEMLISFIVKTDGTVSDVKILKANGSDNIINDIVINHLLSFNNWDPAEYRGEKLKLKTIFLLKFK